MKRGEVTMIAMAKLHPALRLRAANVRQDQQGFTLIEMIVAFFILALLALAALPLMATGLRVSAEATLTTSANQRVQQTLETARVTPVTCTALNSKVGTSTYNDGRGNDFRVTLSLPSGCNAALTTHQAVPIRVEARRARDNKVLTTVITKVFIAGTTTP